MKSPVRGEVWLVDLGLAAKIRPCLVLSVPILDIDRALVTLVPHTTVLRGTRFEVEIDLPFLRSGGFDAQGIVTAPTAKLIRRIGRLREGQPSLVVEQVQRWLGLERHRPDPAALL